MAKLNRTCCICKKKYSYCPTCMADAKKPTWMILFCGENCRDLYNVLNDYNYKLLSKEEAFDKLKGLDLSCTNELPWNFKEMLNEILSVCSDVKEEIVEEPIQEELIVEPVVEQIVEETVVEEVSVQEEKVIEETEEVENKVIEEEIKKPKSRRKTKNVE